MGKGQCFGVYALTCLGALPCGKRFTAVGELFGMTHEVENFKFESLAFIAQGLRFGADFFVVLNTLKNGITGLDTKILDFLGEQDSSILRIDGLWRLFANYVLIPKVLCVQIWPF